MPRYSVTCVKVVTDYLEAIVEAEAANRKEAEAKALALADEQDLYDFDARGHTLAVYTSDTVELPASQTEAPHA